MFDLSNTQTILLRRIAKNIYKNIDKDVVHLNQIFKKIS